MPVTGPAPGDGASSYLDLPFDLLLDAFADGGPAPGGGSAAVVAVALAASLCTMAARLSTGHSARAHTLALEADAVRRDISPLCDEDPRAYARVMAARRRAPEADPASARRDVAAALSDAAVVPMRVVEAGARLSRLAAELALEGNPASRGDAIVAALLAAAGADAAAVLVQINLAGAPGDERPARATRLVTEASADATRARRAADAGEAP